MSRPKKEQRMKRIQVYLLPETVLKLTIYADINKIKVSKCLREMLNTINTHISEKEIN